MGRPKILNQASDSSFSISILPQVEQGTRKTAEIPSNQCFTFGAGMHLHVFEPRIVYPLLKSDFNFRNMWSCTTNAQ